MLHCTTLCWNSAHVATRRLQNSSVSRIGTRYTRCYESYSIHTRLYQAHLHWAWNKINGQYYRDVLLTQKLLSAIRSIAGDVFVFQQDNTPAHRARDTVELLRRETPQLISPDMWPANSLDLNTVDYRVWGMLQECVYRVPIRATDELRKRLVATWISTEHGGLCSWSVAKKTGSMYPCRRWSIWTLAVMLLAWHSSFHTSQPVLFRVTNIWRKATLPSVRWKKFCILQGSVVIFFQVWWTRGFVFFWHNVNNLKYVWIILLKNDFFWFTKVKWLHYTCEVGKRTSYLCQIFSGFNTPKIIKIG